MTHDTEMFGKMDPFVKIIPSWNSKIVAKTKVLEDIGMKPKWNQKFNFFVQDIDEKIMFSVLEEDATTNDLVGDVNLFLNDGTDRQAAEIEVMVVRGPLRSVP